MEEALDLSFDRLLILMMMTIGAAMACLLNEKAERNFPLVEAGVHQPLTSEFYPVGLLFRSANNR